MRAGAALSGLLESNLVGDPATAAVQKRLEDLLAQQLKETRDEFLPGDNHIETCGYKVDKNGTVPYAP